MTAVAEMLVDALRKNGQTISFCESLTAGLAAATLAAVPGASGVLVGGLVTYSADAKTLLAGVDRALIAQHGVVSSAVAREMARGCKATCKTDWAVALTGVAGPGPQDGHIPGEVWIGLAGPKWTASMPAAKLVPPVQKRFALLPGALEPVRVLAGDRNEIRSTAAEAALRGVLKAITE